MRIGYYIVSLASVIINVAEFLMLVRAIFSWIPVPPALSGIYRVVYDLTEPIIAPFRRLLYRSRLVQNCPIDISFLLAILALGLIRNLFWMLV